MLPNPQLPPIELGPLTLYPFGILVATGIMLGVWQMTKRVRELGLDEQVAQAIPMWAVIPGFIGSHLYEIFFYHPERLANPLELLKIWDGMSSFGGFLGGTLGVIYFLRFKAKVPFWHYADTVMYGFTFAWIFGRLGCTVAYDHPGSLTDFFLGMEYRGNAVSHGVRHNLGFYEVFWAAGLFLFFQTQRKRPHVPGFYLLTFVLAYMPFRFALDFLRADDLRHGGLTAGQYAAIGLFLLCSFLLVQRRKVDERIFPNGKVYVFPDGTPAVKAIPAAAPAKNKRKTA